MPACSEASSVKGICGLPPETTEPQMNPDLPPDVPVIFNPTPVTSLLWENKSTITYSFFGGTRNQQIAVDQVIPEWTYYANVTLKRGPDNDSSAIVRIGFDPDAGSWSSIGKGARQVENGNMTMNLGWNDQAFVVSPADRGTILHQFGHVLGLTHEHQSPARGGLALKPDVVMRYLRNTQGWSDTLIKSQVLDVYNSGNVSNYSSLDTNSIMTYFIPRSFNEKSRDIPVNTELSDRDKAFMVINYPYGKPHPRASTCTLEWALRVVGLPPQEQKDILSFREDVNTVRAYYDGWSKMARAGA